jgi:heat shock protein HtpX
MKAIGLQTHIWNNNLRSAFLLAGFPVLLVGMVFALEMALFVVGIPPSSGSIGGDLGYAWRMLAVSTPVAVVVALVWFAIAYVSNQFIVDVATGAHKVERADEPRLYNTLENLAISRGLKAPGVRVIESEAMNAYASGINAGQYTVTVTRGLLNGLEDAELEAVLAHEMSHIISRDVRTMVIAAVFAGIITLVAQLIFRGIFYLDSGRSSSRSGKGGGGVFVILAIAVAAIGCLLAIVIQMALSRSREYVADAGSVELTKNPDAMISALRKVAASPRLAAPDQIRAMFLNDKAEGLMALFTTHPSIDKRIEALETYAGGRDIPAPVGATALEAPGAKPPGPWG